MAEMVGRPGFLRPIGSSLWNFVGILGVFSIEFPLSNRPVRSEIRPHEERERQRAEELA